MKTICRPRRNISVNLIPACILTMVLAAGCSSIPFKMQTPAPDQKYEVLGEGEGSALGIMLFNFIPIGQNSKFERAYEKAIKSQGGDGLINPVVKEKWFWAYILNGYTTTVTGDVIKYVK